MTAHPFIHISRYRTTRYWAVWRGAELIAVTVYRKGAQSVAAELFVWLEMLVGPISACSSRRTHDAGPGPGGFCVSAESMARLEFQWASTCLYDA